jgi:hypothetical protein
MADGVRYERDGHVVTITYDRPEKRNAIDGDMRRAINAAWDRFRTDEEAWVAIVTGEGPAFCAGADTRSTTGNPAGDFPGSFFERPTVNSLESGWEIFKPIVAAVNGPAVGYGVTLLTWCDFVIASDRATFSFPEARLGVPTIVGALRLRGARTRSASPGGSCHTRSWATPPGTSPGGSPRGRRSPSARSRRWRCADRRWVPPRRSASVRRCGRSSRPPRTRRRVPLRPGRSGPRAGMRDRPSILRK